MVYGMIAEYNPFHQGHRYLIEQVKTEADTMIAVMSGNFVQRGDFAVLSKWERTAAALDNGVDLVLELPTPFALKSAEGFAQAAIQMLHATGCTDRLLFGAECADLPQLEEAAALLKQESVNLKIKEAVNRGISYPAACREATGLSVLDAPNNLLAIEYIKALHQITASIQPVAIQRVGSGHDSMEPSTFPSASYLRRQMQDTPGVCQMERCTLAVLSALRKMSPEAIRLVEDVTEGLEYRIAEAVKTADSLPSLYHAIKTKRYTHARIRRMILRAFLGIKKNDFSAIPYLKVLGFREKAIPILRQIRENGTLPLVQKYSDLPQLSADCQALYQAESTFTDQYMLGFSPIRPCGLEMTTPIVKR